MIDLSQLTPAQAQLMTRLADYYRRGEGASCVSAPLGLQRVTKDRPALVFAGGRSPQGIRLPLTPTAAGMELVAALAISTPTPK